MSSLNIITHCALLFFLLTNLMISVYGQDCNPSGSLTGSQPPPGQCDPSSATCCEVGQAYPTYTCSPPVTGQTQAVLTLNSFEDGGDGGGASACDGQFHSDDTLVVALSTGWFDNRSRCGKEIVINGNGNSVKATVVDECDSTVGCDAEHGYQVPCRNNVVDGSQAVWDALGADSGPGSMDITWSDA